MRIQHIKSAHSQRGAAAVEFALIAVIFFTLMFGIIEFGRLMFSINSVQEVTRRAAREQTVRWVTESSAVQREAVLRPGGDGVVNYPGVIDVKNTKVQLSFYNTYVNATNGTSSIGSISNSMENFNNCLLGNSSCIRFVRATLTEADGSPVSFDVIVPFIPDGFFALPRSTVIMPAEALGLL